MAPADQLEEVSALRARIAEVEAQLLQDKQERQGCLERFRNLADAAPFMVWMSGPDALCSFVNRAWLDFRGRNPEDEIGNGWTEGLHPDDRDLCVETYLKSFSARHPFRMQFRARRGNTDYGWLDYIGLPHYDIDGTFQGYIGAAIDVTDHKRGVFTPDEQALRMVLALTERERQVLVLISEGKSTKQAAARLGISYKTADSHRSRILEKLGVHETASMVRYAIRAGLIAP